MAETAVISPPAICQRQDIKIPTMTASQARNKGIWLAAVQERPGTTSPLLKSKK
jgi:hypothetical protein